MYKKIRSHQSTANIYGSKLINENLISEGDLNDQIKKFKDLLDNQFKTAKDYNRSHMALSILSKTASECGKFGVLCKY